MTLVSRQPRALLYTTYINQAEILYGIGVLPDGQRRTALAKAAAAMFAEDFAGRILPFEATAAARYADIVVARRQAGNPIEGFDALIAATALGAGASVALATPLVCRLRTHAPRPDALLHVGARTQPAEMPVGAARIGGDFHPFGCGEHLDGAPRGGCARCSRCSARA